MIFHATLCGDENDPEYGKRLEKAKDAVLTSPDMKSRKTTARAAEPEEKINLNVRVLRAYSEKFWRNLTRASKPGIGKATAEKIIANLQAANFPEDGEIGPLEFLDKMPKRALKIMREVLISQGHSLDTPAPAPAPLQTASTSLTTGYNIELTYGDI